MIAHGPRRTRQSATAAASGGDPIAELSAATVNRVGLLPRLKKSPVGEWGARLPASTDRGVRVRSHCSVEDMPNERLERELINAHNM